MNRLQSIVVGMDFSNYSEHALAQAARLARWNKARLYVVHVVDERLVQEVHSVIHKSSDLDHFKEEIHEHEVAELENEVLTVMARNEMPDDVQVDVRIGTPIDELLQKVHEVSADLLVLGMYGASTKPGGNVGALVTKCVRKIPAKVMLVRPEHTVEFKRVVACIDFSDNSLLAIQQAIHIAKQDQAHLHLVHVFYGPWNHLHYMSATSSSDPTYQQQYKDLLKVKLNNCLKTFKNQIEDLEVTCDLYEHQNYAEGISHYIKEKDIDLVVLGTRGQTKLKYVLMGSTAERVVRNSGCSLLAIKPFGFTFSPKQFNRPDVG